MTRPFLPSPPRRRRPPLGLAWLLVLVLLGAQGLGLGHRLAHGGAHGAHGAVAPAPAHASGAGVWFADHDAGSANCRLLDQLAPDTLTPAAVPVAVLPAPSEGPSPCLVVAPTLAPRHAAQARAPPPHLA